MLATELDNLTEGGHSLGIYVSIPFCKAKCSFCNFASGVFGGQRIDEYLERLVTEIRQAGEFAERLDAEVPRRVDTIYLGGGTPSLLEAAQVHRVFQAIREQFAVDAGAEITVEAAPGQLTQATLEALLQVGVNRLSFGVQSFIDAECAAVGRLHTGGECSAELQRVSKAGFKRVGIDLIAGLPGQTGASWRTSIDQAIESGVEHVSMYMLEVDEDSRLGREHIAGGSRYGAALLPDDDCIAESYEQACVLLEDAGLKQYEISNFAREGGQSRHNRKYWERKPYMGFGLDAHSLLHCAAESVRWANDETMEGYVHGLAQVGRKASWHRTIDRIDTLAALEESLFLGLRLREGVSLAALQQQFSLDLLGQILDGVEELIEASLLIRSGDRIQLTRRGRMVSNEVFSRLLLQPVA